MSKHLWVLREASFGESRVKAQRRVYRIRPEPLMEVDGWLAPIPPASPSETASEVLEIVGKGYLVLLAAGPSQIRKLPVDDRIHMA